MSTIPYSNPIISNGSGTKPTLLKDEQGESIVKRLSIKGKKHHAVVEQHKEKCSILVNEIRESRKLLDQSKTHFEDVKRRLRVARTVFETYNLDYEDARQTLIYAKQTVFDASARVSSSDSLDALTLSNITREFANCAKVLKN